MVWRGIRVGDGNGFGVGDGLRLREGDGLGSEMDDALWEKHTLFKTGVLTDIHTHIPTKVKTIYPPVSLRSPFTWRI